MTKLGSILQQRFRKKEKPKMTSLAEKASEGNLTVFSGVFAVKGLDEKEKEELLTLLHRYSEEPTADVSEDLNALIFITSEVKAIHNQAIILHGERIKKAQLILKKYKEGAFTAWLMSTYGNRQTPYNFLQYYEFYSEMPKVLHPLIESMPRQAIYTLASREGEKEKKEEIVRNYQGETKEQLISLIRALFPLQEEDKRRENVVKSTLKALHKACIPFEHRKVSMTKKQKSQISDLLKRLKGYLESCETYD